MRRAVLAVAALFLLVGARPADAANANVTISPGPVLSPDPVNITEGDTVTWKNLDVGPHTIYLEGTDLSGSIDPGKSYTSPPLAKGTIHYGLAATDKSATIKVAPAPITTTTTTTVKPTTTTSTTVPSTTTASTTTTSSTTTTTSSTTTTAPLATVPVNNSSGGGGSGTALLLGAAAVVVAGLAGAAYWAWSRSDEAPYDDGPPPTTTQPSI